MENMGIVRARRLTLLAYSVLGRKLGFDAIPVFATDRCNSRCRICSIWRKNPKTDLDPGIIKEILCGKAVSRFSGFILTGGEFILHPRHREILSLLNEYKKHYLLLSNGLLPDRLINIVREFGVKYLSLSLDGSPETYKRIRGVDGYSNVERVIRELRDDDVKLNIGYTVSPWNTRDDLIHVIRFCREYGVGLGIGYYCDVEYYDADKPASKLYRIDDLVDHSYHKLYPLWASGNLNMPCLSIFVRPVIRPNGDVELCEPKQIKLGNLHEQSLEEIWRSNRTRMLQRENIRCNGCWHDAQRLCDLNIISTLRPFAPCLFLNRFLGHYDWGEISYSLN